MTNGLARRLTIAGAALATPTIADAQAGSATERVTEVTATLAVRHDTNTARTGRALAAARGLVRSDERATPTIGVTLVRPFGRNALSLRAEAGYDFYRRNTRLNRERISISGSGRLAVGPCDLTLSPSFLRRQSDPGDIAPLAIDGIASVRNTETVQNYAAELRCGRAFGLRPVATVERAIGDNSNDRRQFSDYRTFRYGGGVGYTNPVLGDFTLQALRTDTEYPNRPSSLGRSGFTVDRLQLTAVRELGAVLTARGSISYLTLDPDEAGVDGFSGPGWSAALTAAPTPDLRLTAGLGRDVAPSLGTDALYQVSRSYSLGADYALNSRLSLGLGAAREKRDFEGAGAIFGPALTRSVQDSVTGSVTYAFSPRLGFGAEAGYQQRRANGEFFDYDNRYALLRVSVKL